MFLMTKSLLLNLPGLVWNRSVGLFYRQWSHRYLLYLLAFVLVGVWTFVGLRIYGWLKWGHIPIGFQGVYSWHSMLNFGLCLYLLDEWGMRLTGRWGRFGRRTLGMQCLIWCTSFVVGFMVQRIVVFEGMMYYALDLYHHYEKYPELRPRPLEHFQFCVPFFASTVLILWLVSFVRQRGLEKDRKILQTLTDELMQQQGKEREENLREGQGAVHTPIRIISENVPVFLKPESISHVTVEDHYCRIYVTENTGLRKYFVKMSLSTLLDQVPQSLFARIHRSHAVNMRYVDRLEKKKRAYFLRLKSFDQALPISRAQWSEVLNRLQMSQRN